jgi:chemotaxis protein CheX
MVGLAGYVSGILSVRCSNDSATRIAAMMLGTNGPEAKQQLRDALGEICNMIAGNFKSKVAGLDDGCVLSVPSVISGADYHLYSLVHGASIFVELEFEHTPLWVTLDVECG